MIAYSTDLSVTSKIIYRNDGIAFLGSELNGLQPQVTFSADTARVSQSIEATLNVLEAVAIAISEPRLNLQRGKWSDATKYFQWWDRSEDGEDEEDA